MAALPNTGISISMVKAAIGAGTNDLGSLFLHPNVNEYGFNCPDTGIQNVIWGGSSIFRETLSPNSLNYQQFAGYPPGYHLGNFRGYDHNWKAYEFDDITKSGDDYYSPMIFTISIKEAAAKLASFPDPADVNFTVKMEFKRNSIPAVWTDMGNLIISATTKSNTVQFSPQYPPDNVVNGALAKLEGFQIRATVITPPARRWSNINVPAIILSATTPTSLYTNTYDIRNNRGTAYKRTIAPISHLFEVQTDVWADYNTTASVIVTATMSNTATFTNTYYPTSAATVVVPQSPTPGTKTYANTAILNFNESGIKDVVNVGQTVYIRLFTEGVQQASFTMVVTDEI